MVVVFLLALAFVVATPITAQTLDTLRNYSPKSPFVYYSVPNITMQIARFEPAAPGFVRSIRITVGGSGIGEFTLDRWRTLLRTHVTTKVIRYPAIVRSVTSFRDGVYHFAENIAFNPDNGQPVGVRTADGYDALTLQQSSNHVGSYTAWAFPASGQYPAMGQKGANERLHIRSGDRYLIERRVTAADSVYLNIEYLKPGAASELPRLLYPGDLLRLTNSTTSDLVGIYQIRSVAGVRVWLEPVSINHAEGTPYRVVDLEILRSGRTNQLSANVGSITTYGPPHSPMP